MRQNKESVYNSIKGFVCERCVGAIRGVEEPGEEFSFYDQVELILFVIEVASC